MKKWFVGMIVILISVILGIYIFIPAKIVISHMSAAQATITGEYRYIGSEEAWEKWWRDEKGKSHEKGYPFTYNGFNFRLVKHADNAAGIEIERNGEVLESLLHLISFKRDSTGCLWKCEIPGGMSPVSRLNKYMMATEIKKNMVKIMGNFNSFISDQRNVYGLSIYKTSTKDTALLSATFSSPGYPTTQEIYKYLEVIEKSIARQKGLKTGFPMINLKRLADGSYETQVAIPTNHLLSNEGKICYRRLVPGNFIAAEVKGGDYTVNEAINQLDYYISEYNKVVMAKSFQVLITNRLQEKDTSKWITKVYVPVVE